MGQMPINMNQNVRQIGMQPQNLQQNMQNQWNQQSMRNDVKKSLFFIGVK